MGGHARGVGKVFSGRARVAAKWCARAAGGPRVPTVPLYALAEVVRARNRLEVTSSLSRGHLRSIFTLG